MRADRSALLAMFSLTGLQVTLGLANVFSIKLLSLGGRSAFELLFWRGLVSTVCAFVFAFADRQSLRPRDPVFQAKRFVTSGLAISAVVASYQFLDPSTATLLGKLDIPFLFLMSSFAGYSILASQKVLSLVSIVAALLALFTGGPLVSSWHGPALAVFGALAVSFGYLFLRRSLKTETTAITILTPSLSCVLLGLGGTMVGPGFSNFWPDLPWLLIPGVCMFGLYLSSSLLYKRLPLIGAEIPSLLVPLLAIPIEAVLFQRNIQALYTAGLAITLFLMTSSLLLGVRNHAKYEQVQNG